MKKYISSAKQLSIFNRKKDRVKIISVYNPKNISFNNIKF